MLEDLIFRFRPEPEEELLSAIHTLLVKSYMFVNAPLSEPVPLNLVQMLSRVSRKFFQSSAMQKSSKVISYT